MQALVVVEQRSDARLRNAPPTITLLESSLQLMITSLRRSALLSVLIFSLPGLSSVSSAPVEFAFQVDHDPEDNPFSRDIWAELVSPSGRAIRLPAFFDGNDTWKVRARADEKGNYEFVAAEELINRAAIPLNISLRGKDRLRVKDADGMGAAIAIDPRTNRTFVDGFGQPYVPFGGNLPWAESDNPTKFFRENFARFGDIGLNWTRVWMCHWGQLNLDWIEPHHGDPTPLGTLSLDVARTWDDLIAAAESHQLRLQMVLQHHGQYTTFKDTDWADNPWNIEAGGFLNSPKDFFTDPLARKLTRDKYRYIVARWGYSSSVLAWELFNEVMWTNSRRGDAADNAAVAAWHAEMARHLRRYDVHNHLVTTSDDDLTHEMWGAMDYYQPHLYASNMILGVQALPSHGQDMDRPVFYGEVGDNAMISLSDGQRADGFVHPLLAWSGLFGELTHPAQLWYIDVIRQNDRWDELASAARFARASGLLTRDLYQSSTPSVIGGDTVPWRIEPGYYWERGKNPEFELEVDGSEPTQLMEFRRILTDSSAQPPHSFPSRATFKFRSPAATNARLDVARVSNTGGSLIVTLDGKSIVNENWPAATVGSPAPSNLQFEFRLGYGDHTLVLENPHGPDWVDLAGLELGTQVPALVATAKHSRDRTALWIRHRTNLLSPTEDDDLTATRATVQLEDFPSGKWQLTWWDPTSGRASSSNELEQDGGTLSLGTPLIARHAAAWLERIN